MWFFSRCHIRFIRLYSKDMFWICVCLCTHSPPQAHLYIVVMLLNCTVLLLSEALIKPKLEQAKSEADSWNQNFDYYVYCGNNKGGKHNPAKEQVLLTTYINVHNIFGKLQPKILPSPPFGWLRSLLRPGCRNIKLPMNIRIIWMSGGGATKVRRAKRFAKAATKCSDKCLVMLRKYVM